MVKGLFTCTRCRGPFHETSRSGFCLACENDELMKRIKGLSRKVSDEDVLKEQQEQLKLELQKLEDACDSSASSSSDSEEDQDPDFVPGTPLKRKR